MKLYREDRIEEAAQMLYENNPFSAVTSLVCDWKKSCYGHCVLNARKMPIDWHSIEAEISIPYLKKVHPRTGIDNGKKVAVIGGGPAGITAALELREKGCAVTIFDKNERPGGVLRYGIPEFRLEREIIDQYDRILAEAGVGFAGGTDVNAMKFSEIRREFNAILIACGASVPRRLDIPGEENPDIIYALDYLKNPSAYQLKDNVLVIGGGNFWRGVKDGADKMQRSHGDAMGMLATVMNCIAMADALEQHGVPARVLSAVEMNKFAEYFTRDTADRYLNEGKVVLFAAGTGNPYFSTDTGVVLRAIEVEADVILLAKAVDGVYDSDPKTNPAAKKYDEVSIDEVIAKNLQVVDMTASILARDNKMPMWVFGLNEENSIVNTMQGKFTGTKVTV